MIVVLTDYHCHILPGIDDGAENISMSLAMLEEMKKQQVERVIATPHFYAHREESVEGFLEKRQRAFDSIKEKSPIKDILLGAEVALEFEISRLKGLEKLAVEGTNLILIELPYRKFEPWIFEELGNISAKGLRIVLAHIHRYVNYCTTPQMERIIDGDVVLQINHDAFKASEERGFARELIRCGYPIVYGSDAHNLTTRKPDWRIVTKKCGAQAILASDSLMEVQQAEDL